MDLLLEGAITLTTVTLLGRDLSAEHHASVLESARHKSKADVEMIVATLNPQPDVRSSLRKVAEPNRATVTPEPLIIAAPEVCTLPQRTMPVPASGPLPQRAVIRPSAPERYKLQVTIGEETRAKLRRAQDLLRHTNRSADEAAVIDRALTLLVEQLEKAKFAKTVRARQSVPSNPTARYVSADKRRAVSERDGCRCAFLGSEGRCTAPIPPSHSIC